MPTAVESGTLTASAPPLLRPASNTFFYGYVGLLVIAGAWGMAFARVDMSSLFKIRIETLDPVAQASLLSQYRFLRAIELVGVVLIFTYTRFTLRPRQNLGGQRP